MLLALILAATDPAPEVAHPPDCSYDLDAMLALDRDAFDQDMEGGWRVLAMKDGCEIAAAELIREWRHEKRDHSTILYWHEGQMRAFGGQTSEALDLFQLTYKPPEFDADFGWNHYVSGTIAFLLRDREHLRRSITALEAVPRPDSLTMTRADGTTFEMAWPPNLDVLKAFDKCWDKTYSEAYATAQCRSHEG